MKILIVGGGGREHALAWKIHQNREVSAIYAAPGNAGIAEIAECIPLQVSDIAGLSRLAREKGIDLTIVGPELPLSLGIVDEFEAQGLAVFGPCREAVAIESSKVFAKRLMKENNIPTASYEVFSDPQKAKEYVRHIGRPLVIKADGLAAGKGVVICQQPEEALKAIELIMVKQVFGQAGKQIIIEEYLSGEEASFLAFTDGQSIIPLASSQDHKTVYDGDRGPNTGGMGAYSPAPVISEQMQQKIMTKIMAPAIEGLARLGITYRGVLYAGLMIQDNEPMLLEFNARFGDPETQTIIRRLETDLVLVIQKVLQTRLHEVRLDWRQEASTCVVLASAGYPDSYQSGKEIIGLEEAARVDGVVLFHAGTTRQEGRLLTSGGRVLGVSALGETIAESISRAYAAVAKISFEGMHYRKDIGQRALSRSLPKSRAA
ncbi:MAG: phosphoribosylamine--glycine ligase [bacterium]|nr:phosphoribosylamine--glycine ligase [bacterium]